LAEHAGANDLESQDARMVPRLPGEHGLTNLPAPVSELIGRDHVLAEIQNLLSEHRLVTLTGSGGIGKTRLAVAAARGMLSNFAHGVWLSDLSPLVDAALVATRVAGAVGLEVGNGQISAERVAQVLADRQLLLVLDTCEHLIAAAAELVEAALRAGEGIHFLVTSREPLQVEGERVCIVVSLVAFGRMSPAYRAGTRGGSSAGQ
jgi:predicted ATPase